MKLTIDTDSKTIIVEDATPILEIINFLREKDMEEWSIKSKEEPVDFFKEFFRKDRSYIPPALPNRFPYYPYKEYRGWYQPYWYYDEYSQPSYTTCANQNL